jgi:hypothetical protein
MIVYKGNNWSCRRFRFFEKFILIISRQTKFRPKRYPKKKAMKEQEKVSPREQTDEIGTELETGGEANAAVEQQGDDAATGIPRDTDAARHEKETDYQAGDNRELTGAP